MTTDERTRLLQPAGSRGGSSGDGADSRRRSAWAPENRILLAGFLITLAFSYTQVPLLYAFRIMECDAYYDSHPPHRGLGDRCERDEIAAGTATQYGILGMSTTLCGTINLFIAGWTVKHVGPRLALVIQTVVPAVRVAAQILGVVAGKRAGMVIIQATQLITILGGPAGYILVVNIFASELVDPSRRTGVFGKLQGCIMLGQGIGYLAGGLLGDVINITAPFEVAFASFLLAAAYSRCALPYISPESISGRKPGQRTSSGFLAPIKILAPRVLRDSDGRIFRHYGTLILCGGIFIGVLATGYAPSLVQLYATASFGFTQGDVGWLMSEFAMTRACFLIFIFPRIISWGRARWTVGGNGKPAQEELEEEEEACLPDSPQALDVPAGEQSVEEPVEPTGADQGREGSRFDLVFLRWSLVVDGALTTIAAFATRPWHIYLAAFLLPFGSGSAPAAKGVITEMCSDAQRADALNAVTLVENVARLATQGLFGFIFASLAEQGTSYATFFCNAAVAVVGVVVLLFARFPPLACEAADVRNSR